MSRLASADCLATSRAIDRAASMTAGQLAQAAYAASISLYITSEVSRTLADLAARAYASQA